MNHRVSTSSLLVVGAWSSLIALSAASCTQDFDSFFQGTDPGTGASTTTTSSTSSGGSGATGGGGSGATGGGGSGATGGGGSGATGGGGSGATGGGGSGATGGGGSGATGGGGSGATGGGGSGATGGGGSGGGPICGNGGAPETGEECDDGNTDPGDRCGPTCLDEHPEDCPGTPIAIDADPIVIQDDTTGGNDTVSEISSAGSCFGGTYTGEDLTYAITPSHDGTLWAELAADYADHFLHVRTACPGVATDGVDCDYDGSSTNADVVEFPVVAGTTYYLFVDSYANNTAGTFTLTLDLSWCGDGVVDPTEECDDGNAVDDANGCSATCQVDCGGDDESTDHHCYRLVTGSAATWADALTACGAIGTGWDLVAISSATERAFIDNTVDPNNNQSLWTGGSDATTEGTYTWTNGETWWEAWIGGEPDGAGAPDEDCIALRTLSGGSNDAFEDRLCTETLDYICELTPAGLP